MLKMAAPEDDPNNWREITLTELGGGHTVTFKIQCPNISIDSLRKTNPVDDLDYLMQRFLKDPHLYVNKGFIEPIKELRKRAEEIFLIRDDIYKAIDDAGFELPYRNK
jgi:hypothetical protein